MVSINVTRFQTKYTSGMFCCQNNFCLCPIFELYLQTTV